MADEIGQFNELNQQVNGATHNGVNLTQLRKFKEFIQKNQTELQRSILQKQLNFQQSLGSYSQQPPQQPQYNKGEKTDKKSAVFHELQAQYMQKFFPLRRAKENIQEKLQPLQIQQPQQNSTHRQSSKFMA